MMSKIEQSKCNNRLFIKKTASKQLDSSLDDNLPNTITLLRTPDGGKCYLVGTAHFSIDSQNEVSWIIQAVQPHIITVELCFDRIDILRFYEKRNFEEITNLSINDIIQAIKENGMEKGLFLLLNLKLLAKLTKTLGLIPGGEFRCAVKEAKRIPNCLVHMGDRPIKITFDRALSYLTWWQKIKLAFQLFTKNINFDQKDIEKYKNQDLVEQFLTELSKEYPALGEVFVKERDIYLTHSLQLACESKIDISGKLIPARVVGVVGIGHTFGIIQNWGKINAIQIPPIMSTPPTSFRYTVLIFTTKIFITGTIIYIIFQFFSLIINTILLLKSSIEF